MSRPQQFLEDAIAAAKRAVQFDTDKQYEPAVYFYTIAAKLLNKAADISEAEKAAALRKKSEEYSQRATDLEQLKDAEYATHAEDEHKKRLKRLHFLLQQGLDSDNAGLKDTAVDLYAQAIEYVTHYPELMHGELKEIVLQALERAEALKGIKRVSNEATSSVSSNSKENVRKSNFKPLLFTPKASPTLQRSSSIQLKVTGGKDGYTEDEKRVLFHTSRINKNEYVPFMSIDLKEKFQYAINFTDKDGVLALSPKQKREFAGWVRPEDICTDPCIVLGEHPDYYSIKQTIVSDCSFVASLAVSAQYERRFVKKIITAKIFPRTKDKRPIYNPFGKYMVKLILNGVARKVIIDDTLPISKHGRLLCSYSSNRNEFWVSLLEKAYMKVMGGYDFPGSNSNIDLHALTGWIPERIAIRSKEQDFNKDALFNTLETRLSKGDVLITTATGELSDAEAERTGLVATHAYAILDVRNVNGARLLKLKNPWSHLRWKGNYSELDTRHWTPELQRLLNYDPNSASQFDNGVFWIDYDSICAFFEVFYLNWNPELFQYTYCTHQAWHACTGPVKDLYNIGHNPQFSLEVGSEAKGAVWVLLTRHITDIDDFRENKEYITLLVYNTNGKRVYYPSDPPPYIDGVRINSPHYLCKIILNPTSTKKYTLVVSQYEKTQTIFYTIRAYATCPFTLSKIEDPYVHTKEVTGEWKGVTAGGCGNYQSTYSNNPKYRVEIEGVRTDNEILIELKGPKQYQIGFDVTIVSVNDATVTAPFKTMTSGPFRSGFVVLELNNIPCGVLNIVPSTFLPGQEGPFILTVKSRLPLQISRER